MARQNVFHWVRLYMSFFGQTFWCHFREYDREASDFFGVRAERVKQGTLSLNGEIGTLRVMRKSDDS